VERNRLWKVALAINNGVGGYFVAVLHITKQVSGKTSNKNIEMMSYELVLSLEHKFFFFFFRIRDILMVKLIFKFFLSDKQLKI
jgi:hypothetical protein